MGDQFLADFEQIGDSANLDDGLGDLGDPFDLDDEMKQQSHQGKSEKPITTLRSFGDDNMLRFDNPLNIADGIDDLKSFGDLDRLSGGFGNFLGGDSSRAFSNHMDSPPIKPDSDRGKEIVKQKLLTAQGTSASKPIQAPSSTKKTTDSKTSPNEQIKKSEANKTAIKQDSKASQRPTTANKGFLKTGNSPKDKPTPKSSQKTLPKPIVKVSPIPSLTSVAQNIPEKEPETKHQPGLMVTKPPKMSDNLLDSGVAEPLSQQQSLTQIDAGQKNKFLNVQDEDDFLGESNAISDQVGEDKPRVNFEGSQVSNRNFEEKMIETVNSEQVDSMKGKTDGERSARPMMQGIGEVQDENDNSNTKTAQSPMTNRQITSQSEKPEKFSSDIYNKGSTRNKADDLEEPLNEPTFLQEKKPNAKRPITSGADAAKNRLEQMNGPNASKPIVEITKTSKKASVPKVKRPSSSKVTKQKEPEAPKKKERLPDFGLKKKEVKDISLKELEAKMNSKLEKQGGGADNKPPAIQAVGTAKQTAKKKEELDPEVASEIQENEAFKNFLKQMTKVTKAELQTIEDNKKWKPKGAKQVSDAEVKRKLIATVNQETVSELNNPKKRAEEEKRKKEIDDAKAKLKEFQEANKINYPKPKLVTPPVLKKQDSKKVEQSKPPNGEPELSAVQKANMAIRSDAWKKRPKTAQAGTGESPDKPKDEGVGFTIAQEETGQQSMPGQAQQLGGIQGFEMPASSIQLETIKEEVPKNTADDQAWALDSQPLALSTNPIVSKSPEGKKSADQTFKIHKQKVALNYKKQQEAIRKKDEELFVTEELDKRLRKIKDTAGKQEDDLMHQFVVENKGEELEKQERMDKFGQVNKLYRYGERPKKQKKDALVTTTSSVRAGQGFSVHVGAGITGELERQAQADQRKDIKVRQFELETVLGQQSTAKQTQRDQFKERLIKEKELLQKRKEIEQSKVDQIRQAHRESIAAKKEPLAPTDHQVLQDQNKPSIEVIIEEDSEPEDQQVQNQGPSVPKIKLRHALKLKGYLEKMILINDGLLQQLKEREEIYQDIKKNFEAQLYEERKNQKDEIKSITDQIIQRMGIQKLFNLLNGGKALIKTQEATKAIRVSESLSQPEKKALRQLFQLGDQEFYTFNSFEELLTESVVANCKLVKTPAEIETDKKLQKYSFELEDFGKELSSFKSRVEAREGLHSYEAYTEIKRLKNRQTKHLLMMDEMLSIAFQRSNDLLSEIEKGVDYLDYVDQIQAANEENINKLTHLGDAYQESLKQYEENDRKLQEVNLFDLENFEEECQKVSDIKRAAYEAANEIHTVSYKKKSDVLDFLSFVSSKRKATLIIQAFFRGHAARKKYRVKRCIRQRIWYLSKRCVLRFRKRVSHKIIADLLTSYERFRLFVGFSLICKRPEQGTIFDRALQPVTLKLLKGLRTKMEISNLDKSQFNQVVEEGDQAIPDENQKALDTSSITEVSLGKNDKSSNLHTEDVDGKAIFYSIILQRLYRRYRKISNPGVFWVAENSKTETCRVCMINRVRIVQPDNVICLFCRECFYEFNSTKKRSRQFVLLKPISHGEKQKSSRQNEDTARDIMKKVYKLKDLKMICANWDYGKAGNLSISDMELIVERLKMISSVEKRFLLEYIRQFVSQNMVDYKRIIGNLI